MSRLQVRESILWRSFWGLIITTVAILLVLLPWLKPDFPAFIAWFGAFWIILLALFTLASLRSALRPSNWVIRVGPEGLLVKFRSFMNYYLPPGDQVVAVIPRLAVRVIIPHKRVLMRPKSSQPPGKGVVEMSVGCKGIDIELDAANLAELVSRLEIERKTMGQTGKRSRSRYGHIPARLVEGQRLRIDWSTPESLLSPGLNKTLPALALAGFTIAPPMESREAEFDSLDKKAAEDRILEMSERGDSFGAIALARKLYDMDLTEAKKFVEGLGR